MRPNGKLIKQISCCFLAVLLTSVCLSGLFVKADDTRTVRMGYFEYGSMCRGASEGAEKSGYVYDFMQKISSYTGWKYEYSYGTYAEEYALLKEGKIDILPYTNWNEERSREVLFSREPILNEVYYLATRAGDNRFKGNDPSSLNGKIIATVTGADQNNLLLDYLLENDIDASVVYFDTPEISWDSLDNAYVDAAVFSNISYRSDVDWNVFCSFGSKPTYIAVSKGNEKLLAELDSAFDTLLQTNPTFISQLEETVSSGNPALNCLSESELNWLKAHETIRFGYIENSNLVYVNKKSNVIGGGFTADLISLIFGSLAPETKFDYIGFETPAAMAEALIAGDVDIVYPLFPSFSYAERYSIAISNSLTEDNMALVYRKDTSSEDYLSKVAVSTTSLAPYYMEYHYPDSDHVRTSDTDEAIRLLRDRQVTGFVGESFETLHYVKTYGDLDEIILPSSCETCFGTRLEDSPLIVLMNRGLGSVSKSEIAALVANNTPVEEFDLLEYIRSHTDTLLLAILVPVFIIGLILALSAMVRLRKKVMVASEAKTKFLFNMSHEIRTPMNAILGYTDIAIRHKDNPERLDSCLENIKTSGGHLLNLINDILEMSRIESGKLELTEVPLDIREAIANIDQMSRALAEPKNIDFKTVTGEISDPFIMADELHINEVLINLISNAIKYTEEGGRVEYHIDQISEAKDGKADFRFTVSDNGIGMSDEFQKQLFENFTRENNPTVSRQEGAGLGLSIVKKIVDMTGGTIRVNSRKGEGSVFTVEMPIRLMDQKAQETFLSTRSRENVLDNTSTVFKGRRVLLVEDNMMNREIATDLLTEAGFEVETAEDGSVAVEKVKANGISYYDYILMDIQMPVMNGFEATAEIRKLPNGSLVPIIALSANAFREDRFKSLSAGMNAHVAKPIDVNVLLDVMRSLRK